MTDEEARLHVDLDRLAKELGEALAKLRQIDEILIVNWIAVKNGNYRDAIIELLDQAVREATDPAVSPEAAMVQQELTELDWRRQREASLLRCKFCGFATSKGLYRGIRANVLTGAWVCDNVLVGIACWSCGRVTSKIVYPSD